jgi:HEAT repeat protein
LLGEYADSDPTFPGRLTQTLQSLKKQALPELGARLAPSASPRGLRKAILACVAKFDWPEWAPWVFKALQTEPDLGIFDEGCAALGAIGTRACLAALRDLQRLRPDQDHQTILVRELALFQPQQANSYYLSRLMEGQGNPRLASQGAKLLGTMVGEQDLPALTEAYQDGDPLSQRLALRVIGELSSAQATDFLLALAEQIRQDLLDHRLLLEQINRMQTLPRASSLPELVRQAVAQFGEQAPDTVARLQQAAGHDEGETALALEDLQSLARGVYQHFILDALTLVTEGKVARYSGMISEAAQSTGERLNQLVQQGDQVAECLTAKVDAGELQPERVLPLFTTILRSHVGGDGFIHAFLRLLPVSETALLDELLADPDMNRRVRYLHALGTREDDALTPFFTKAIEDPIVEVGQLAIHHLGKLPSSFPTLMAMFQEGDTERVRLAISVFKENRTQLAAEPLLRFLQSDGRDTLLVDAVEAIAAIGYQESAPVLLELLHDGKPLNLQLALARALKLLANPTAGLGLLAKAPALKQAQVLILALEGALAAFPGFDKPMPLDQLPGFLQLLERCCDEREGEGQKLRAVLATQELYVFDRAAYERLKDRFSDYLFDMRTKEAWDRDSNDRVAVVIKELGRRGESLGHLAQKEVGIRAQIKGMPPKGPKRIEGLLALRESLQDPELIIRPEIGQELAVMVKAMLLQPAAEWRETAHLCEIGGLTHQGELLIDPIREVFQRATGLGLKSAARSALLALDLEESELNRRAPIRSILLLEPSAFFRKRLATFLAGQGSWVLTEAGNRHEAEELLAKDPVHLVLTESKDADGDLALWLEGQWFQNRIRYALVSTSNRDLGELAQAAWVLGVLFKPYPLEQVLGVLAI